MSRYRFRLETVLRVRRVEEEGAKRTLGAASMALRAAIDQEERARERYRSLAGAEREICTVDELLGARLHAELLAEEVTRTQRALIDAASAAAFARVQWSMAARRVASIERLDQRRRAEHAAEELRVEAVFVDDIVTSRYLADVPLETATEIETATATARR